MQAQILNIAFLFGAGISQPAGIEKTNEITDNIIERRNEVVSGNDKPFLIIEREKLKQIFRIFDTIKTDFNEFYTELKREMNYEDYYYIVDSLDEDQSLNFENPIVTYYSRILYQKLPDIFCGKNVGENNQRLFNLTTMAKQYIQDHVVESLCKEPTTLDHLEFLSEAHKDNGISEINIFTLNHDIFLERFWKKKGIDYSDGFVRADNKHKVWNSASFNSRINFFKMHGSIDWYYNPSSDLYNAYYYKNIGSSREDGRPIILIGSLNKLHQYNRSINFELQCLFANKLESCNYIVISGYSFGDQGINTRIIEWLARSNKRKLIIVHKKECMVDLTEKARPAIQRLLESQNNNNTILTIPKFIEIGNRLEWKEIKDLI